MADQTPHTKAPVLDLGSITEVLTVKAPNGENYPLRSRAARSVVELSKITTDATRIDELVDVIPNLTVEQATELAMLIDRTCRAVWEAPDDVQQMIDDRQRLDVINVFLALHTPTLPAPGANETQEHETTDPSTSATSPVDSAASMEAVTPGIG